jgi:serine/threonine protein kinase
LDEEVAIKILARDLVRNDEARARFRSEARAAVKIKSESAARIFDVGALEDGAPYIVMELLEGLDLERWLLDRGRLPIALAVDFVTQACVAVAEAHAMGIVHRDLKPSNLFCVRRDDGRISVKVLDFGIAKLTQASYGARRPKRPLPRPAWSTPRCVTLTTSRMAVNDGLPHTIDVVRQQGQLFASIDGTQVGQAPSQSDLEALPPLQVGQSPCDDVDGTLALVGAVTDLCMTNE